MYLIYLIGCLLLYEKYLCYVCFCDFCIVCCECIGKYKWFNVIIVYMCGGIYFI